MDLKQLKKLINEEVSKFKLKEQDLKPDETTVTDPNISQNPEKTPPATPMAKLGQKRSAPPPPDPNELPPELQGDDDGFEGFGKPQMLEPDEDTHEPAGQPRNRNLVDRLLEDPKVRDYIIRKLRLDIPSQYKPKDGEKTAR